MTDWTHKLVKTENLSVETLLQMAHPENAREHPDHQLEATEELIETIGLIDEIKVNLRTNRVINGHARIKIALQSGQTSLPVNWYDLTEDEERLALEQYDATTYEATYNPDKLRALMEKTKGIKADRPVLQAIMERLKAREGIDGNGGEPPTDPGPQVDKAAQLAAKWGTQTGQVWALGEHRLAVGDCTDKAVAEAVMRGERANLCFTSPPYNRGTTTGGGFPKQGGMWQNAELANGYNSFADNMPTTKYRDWQKKLLLDWWEVITEDGAIYYNHRPRVQDGLFETPLDWNPGLPIRQIVIWYSGAGINFAPTHYRVSCEWIVIYAKPNFRLTSKSISGLGDVWKFGAEQNPSHPAPFPVELPKTAIETTNSNIVYDPFLGSGTTLVACEQLKRKCRAIEIDPGYCGVAIQRWADLTGQEPTLLSE